MHASQTGATLIYFFLFFSIFFLVSLLPDWDYSDAIAALSEEMLRQTFEPGSLHRVLIEP
jgi:hypothetical protein